jgi:hypothetical protein
MGLFYIDTNYKGYYAGDRNLIQCKVYFLGMFLVLSTQWDLYPQKDMNDNDWRRYYRTWMHPWCRYLCTYKLVKG